MKDELLEAATNGDADKIKEILSNMHDEKDRTECLASPKGSGNMPAFHYAAAGGHLDALKLLIPHHHPGIVNKVAGTDGRSALHLAAINGHSAVVNWLVDHQRADLNLQDNIEKSTALHFSVKFGRWDVVKSLVCHGAQQDILDKHNMFPVSYSKDKSTSEAYFSSCISRSFSLRDGGRRRDANNRLLLHYAAQYATDSGVIAMLIDATDPDLVYAEDKDGDSFFHVAAKYGNMNVFKALDKIDQIDMARLLQDNHGSDPLKGPGMYALLYDQREFFKELVDRWEIKITLSSIIEALIVELIDNPEIQDRLALFANTLPTYLALYAEKHFIFDFLLDTLLSLGQWDDTHYRTCLHWAIVDKRADIVEKISTSKKLWQQRPGIQDMDGKTVQELAFEQKNHMVMELLSAKTSFKDHEEKLYKNRELYAQALDAILVGATLIASVTFAGWLQLPFGAEFDSLAMKIYWTANSISFFTAVATMCVTKAALIPTPSLYVGVIVNQLRVAILVDAFLLAISLAAVVFAFSAAGFGALRQAHIYEYQVIMRSSAAIAGFVCLITWLAYIYQLTKCTPSRTVLYSVSPSWLGKTYSRLGDSSRLGYPSMKRSDLLTYKDQNLVPYLSLRRILVSHTESSKRTPKDHEIDQLLQDLQVVDKERLRSNLQRRLQRAGTSNGSL
ncbi:hypothetical protein KP509_37G034300 [Ceratopteris richardii]|uniref:PGG domain-containing protein n=1 Tax=Ceratopteris richardii TaxID=49495 RepID=A0A8T2Q7Y8_CERRI|nr:hypothetical protein KP509_37G034300 [Ceratopteris richardii]